MFFSGLGCACCHLKLLYTYHCLSFCPFSIGHCIVCPSSVYGYFWLPFGIFWPLYCLSFFGLRLLLITLWYLLTIVLSVLLRFTASDYPLVSSDYGFWLPFGICWTVYCLSFGLRLLITLWYLLAIVLSVILRFTLLITLWYLLAIALSVFLRFTATSDYRLVSFGHCIVCHSSVYSYFWLPFGILWPLYCLSFFGLRFWLPFGIFWLLYCLSFFGLRLLLITIWYHLAIVLSVILRFTATSHYPLVSFGHSIVCHSYIRLRASDYSLVSFGHCFVCPSSYRFWLPLWYLLAIVLSVLPVTASDYPLVSFGHCFVCPSSYGFWLPFGIFWPLFCLSFQLRLLITL